MSPKPPKSNDDVKADAARPDPPYSMTISRLTVDKLGVRLYDKVSAVIAELIANGYDADATKVTVSAPMGEYLAEKKDGAVHDRGFNITISDNGIGMTPAQINGFFLRVGGERRNDPERGDLSKRFGRKVMGRKGVGKLAPFGICSTIEVLSSGGDLESRTVNGKTETGHRTAHFFLDRTKILEDSDTNYHPDVGALDGTLQPHSGTKLVLTNFTRRQVPSIDSFARQLAQRFGIATKNWQICLEDTAPSQVDTPTKTVDEFQIDEMEGTRIKFNGTNRDALGPDGKPVSGLASGFEHDGKFYALTGWAAYSKQPYKDELMAGIRIYCRGKIAAQTSIFNLKAGFHGEYDVRSYLVGELSADWLDEKEDLIQTDRRDILWSDDLGKAFETWGQSLVQQVGKMSRAPIKARIWDRFREAANLERKIEQAFPGPQHKELRATAMAIAKIFGQSMREEQVADKEQVEALVKMTFALAPHVKLTEMLQAASDAESSAGLIAEFLRIARLAELSSFGTIALERVRVIERITELMKDPANLEAAYQELLTEAPWIIDPQWSPITSNRSFASLTAELERLFEERKKKKTKVTTFNQPKKRADFVLAAQDGILQLIEIKQPKHALEDEEMVRINNYLELMDEFFSNPANQEFRTEFPDWKITLICDELNLTGVHKTALKGQIENGRITHISWAVFLKRTHKMHGDFLKEAERQKQTAAREYGKT